MPAFSAALATPLLFPASPGWDEARKAWDLAVDQHPAAIALPESVADVAAARSPTELTATERRVASLIAAGATNRDAAAELFVSVRTVETHVASIYRKLGVRNRAELARKLSAPQAGRLA